MNNMKAYLPATQKQKDAINKLCGYHNIEYSNNPNLTSMEATIIMRTLLNRKQILKAVEKEAFNE